MKAHATMSRIHLETGPHSEISRRQRRAWLRIRGAAHAGRPCGAGHMASKQGGLYGHALLGKDTRSRGALGARTRRLVL
jgi:hypothetical protein